MHPPEGQSSSSRSSLACPVARVRHLSAGAAAFGVGTVWPNEECIPLVRRVLEKGRQACFQEPTVFLWACDL